MDALRDWHDFYLLIGATAATLVGLMFVAASIGATYFTAEREAGLRAFLTPTVTHFTAIVVACLIVTVPTHDPASFSALLLAEAGVGIGYSSRVWLHMRRRGFTSTIDLPDRLWYAASPVASYVMIAAAAVLVLLGAAAALDLLAAALLLLLLLGIRNAWDMTAWMMLRAPTK